MTHEWNLKVYNPSDYERDGFATIPLRDILDAPHVDSRKPLRLTLHDREGIPIPFQIDPLDSPVLSPENLSRAALVFHQAKTLLPGPEDYSTPSDDEIVLRLDTVPYGQTLLHNTSEIATPIDDKLKLEVLQPHDLPVRVELTNSQLVVSFNLRPASDPNAPTGTWWYSGSATSVRLNGQEMLEPWNCYHWIGHDPDKRCMQIDHIRVEGHPSEMSTPQKFFLFDRPYELISTSEGPVRTSVTVASEPFHYSYDGLPGERHYLKCQLLRTISLYANADYVMEELSVRGFDGNNKPLDVNFSAHYFACMDMGFAPYVYQSTGVPDWFAVGRPDGYPQVQHPGYGFACDVHAHVPLANPHPHYHNSGNAHKTFSWQLHACQKATCLHLFMHGTPGGFDSRIGHYWYELIYRPLRARLYRKDRECTVMR